MWYACRVADPERPSDEDLLSLAVPFAKRFVQRWDCYSRQLDDGRYICIHSPLRTGDLVAHLRGDVTLGTYLLDQQSRARFIVLDADDDQSFERLVGAAPKLAGEGAPAYLEKSRRGGHLWLFLAQAVPGHKVRAFGKGVAAIHKLEKVELFPKQDNLSGGPGSLIRLPFGIHQKTGKRYSFITPDGKPLAPTIRDQIQTLSHPWPVMETAFEAYQSVDDLPQAPKKIRVSSSNAETVSARIKEAVSVLEFVSQYVALSPSGMGRCPFHDDTHPSFAVNDKDNYWHCFAGCGGGSVIDFYMKLKDCDFVTAVADLAQMVLQD